MRYLAIAVVAGIFFAACDQDVIEVPEFVEKVARPSTQPLFMVTSGDATAELYEVDSCAFVVATAPGHGEYTAESCEPGPGVVLTTPSCARSEGSVCRSMLHPFMVGRTLPDADAVCVTNPDPGLPRLLDVKDGWWMIAASACGI